MLRRKAIAMESLFCIAHSNVAVAFRVANKAARDEVCEKIAKSLAPFHTHLEGDELVFIPRDVRVHKIPDHIKDLKEQCYYLENHFSKTSDVALGTIAVSDDSVVFSVSHGICDGGTIKDVAESLSTGKDLPSLHLPHDSFTIFKDEIERIKCFYDGFTQNKGSARYIPKDREFNYSSGNSRCEHVSLYDYEFKCHDKKDNKLHGLTEAYHAAMALSVAAMNGKWENGGVWEVIGTKQYGNKKFDMRQGNFYSIIPVDLNGATEQTTIKEMMKLYRQDLTNKMKKNAHYASLNAFKYGWPEAKELPGESVVRSAIGSIKMQGPLKDVFLMTHWKQTVPRLQLNIITYAADTGDKKRFDITSEHSPAWYSDREDIMWVNLVKSGLTKLDYNMTIGDAVNFLKDEAKDIMRKTDTTDRIIKV